MLLKFWNDVQSRPFLSFSLRPFKEETVAGWIRTTWLPFTSRIPEDLRKEIVARVVQPSFILFRVPMRSVRKMNPKNLEMKLQRFLQSLKS